MSLAQLPPRDRIIRSLFSEKDETGAALESYITHVKIFEDVQYPSEPPPAPTPQENLKERYILLSVKKNGRVRMHKSRANDNGTFQIGKTWNLEDLQKIQDTDKRGLIINLQKPYYWTMETTKDKYMFVSALTKVYKKYTGGRMFEMLNFESHNVPADRPIPASQRQERSVSAQVPSQRLAPQPLSPMRSQRAVSDVQDKLSRETPRQGSVPITQPSSSVSNYAPIPSPAAPNSRVTSSHYGGNNDRLSTATDTVRSPASARPQQRSVSGTTDDRSRRGAVPFASPPPISSRTMSIESNDLARTIDAKPQNRMPIMDPRPMKTFGNDLGSPMSFSDGKPPGSPVMDRPPEKSLRRQAVESPTSEMAPALPRHIDFPPQSPMSPPPPAKSPARRPSNIRLNTGGSSKALQDRLTGMVSPVESGSNSPVPEIPSLPSKSGARSADVNKSQDRGLPWSTPVEKTTTEDYFSKPTPQVTKPLGIPATANTFASIVESNDHLSPSAPDPLVMANNNPPNEDVDGEPSLIEEPLDDESAYIDEAIRDFRWTAQHGADVLASRLEDELAVLEAANAHTLVENDARVEDLMVKLDKGIAQCDDMINILTIYDFELATISDSVKHIEGQSQGLQVQTANQQSLVNEISRVLKSITISESDLDALKGRGGNLESPDGVTNIEASLVNLYRALKSLRDEKSNNNDQSMSALQPKKKEYLNESNAFLARLSQYLQIKFQAALLTKEAESISRLEPPRVLQGHERGFLALAPYAALMLYAREIEPNYHSEYMRAYAAAAKSSWQGPILDFAGQWRSRAKKATPEENEHIFTAARDQQTLGPARNATLKRSNTIAKQIKSVTTTKSEKDVIDSRPPASEVFRTILDNLALLLANEQNFLVSFFHLSSFNNYEFPDYVELEVKSRITIESLDDHKPTEPSRTFAKEKYILMESIFGWLNGDLAELVDYLARIDSIQVVGIIKSIEVVCAEWVNSDQEFMLRTLQRLKDRLMGLLNRFIEAQVKAIKDIKVTSKKRKGVIPVFEIFPDFVERVEIQLQSTESENVAINQLEIRATVNEAYEQMSKAMFQSVKTLASSATVTAHGLADPEDKEILNYHILMVQNMHQYLEALQSRNNLILEDFQYSAQKQYTEHLISYTRQIIVRPIGRLMEFSDAFEKSQDQGEDTLSKASFSSTSLRRLLSDHDERDLRKGISAMRKRVEKHFGEEDGGSPILLAAAWKTTQQEYLSVVDKILALVQAHYNDVKPDWSRQNLAAAFAKREM